LSEIPDFPGLEYKVIQISKKYIKLKLFIAKEILFKIERE